MTVNARTARAAATRTADILAEEEYGPVWTNFDSRLQYEHTLADRLRDLWAELDYYEANFNNWVAAWQAEENAEGVIGAGSHIVDYLLAKMNDLRVEINIAEEELGY